LYQPTYHVSVFDCDVEESVDVNVRGKYDAPNIIYSAEIVDLCVDSRNQSYIADGMVQDTYAWFINDVKQPTIDNVLNIEWYDTTQTYTIKVIAYDALGCESEPKLISVRTEACQRFFAPNSFTPNGDGINDIFEVRGLSIYKPIVKIFNRWGVEVYVSSNLYWTGDSGSGYYCDNGVYNWIIEYKDKDGFNKNQKGFVTLIR
jgi:gliding motility-associated-like protein